MTDFRADLHTHTTCSDGSMTPEELVYHAKEIGLSGLSITDHDSINAYKTAIPAAKLEGLWLGSGVEFSSMEGSLSVHILGYDIDLDSQPLLELCKRHHARRWERNERILHKLEKRGLRVDREGLEAKWKEGVPIGRPHIAQALVEKGYVRSIQSAFNQLIGDQKPCFDPGEPIETDETLSVIHKANGKAFLAHPHLIRKQKEALHLLDKPFDGIECYYSKCNPDQEKFWVLEAQKRGLMMSGGSDFHGVIKPGIPLGCSWVTRTVFEQIFEKNRWS